MAILTTYASDYINQLKESETKKTVYRYYSDFSPKSSDILNEESTTLLEAYFSYYIYSGLRDDSLFKGDGTVRFVGNNLSVTILNDVAVGNPGKTGQRNVTEYVNNITGEFDYVYGEMQKSWVVAHTYDCGFTGLKVDYYYLPYKVSWSCDIGGDHIDATITDHETNTLQLTAYAAEGYDFAQWSDGVTTATRSDIITENIDFVAQFTPHIYTVNYYDISSGEKLLYTSETYEYGTSYSTPILPIYENIPEGYGVNPVGWTKTSTSGSIRYGTKDIYSGSSTTTIIDQYTEIYNLTSINNEIVELYFNLHPIQYKITHKIFLAGSTNNYNIITKYRIYGNGNYSLADLPTTLTQGYKLTNRMVEENGQEDFTIINSWFISENAMKPGDETITYIDSLCAENKVVYAFETPINYFVHFHTCDLNGNEISLETLLCKYANSYLTPIPNSLENQTVYGWYSSEQDISTWYILNSTNTMVNGISEVTYNLGSTFNNITEKDYSEIHYYSYHIPRGYQIKYQWIDDWGQGEFPLPQTGIHVYGRDGLPIELIPNYDEYIIENVNTINWYYYENNDLTTTQLINEWTTVPLDFAEDRIFYALKAPLGRHITFGVNEETWGKVIVENPKFDDIYQEEDKINVYVEASEWSYFSHWSDGNRWPIREIIVGGKNINYIAYFRSNQIYIQRPIIKEGELIK